METTATLQQEQKKEKLLEQATPNWTYKDFRKELEEFVKLYDEKLERLIFIAMYLVEKDTAYLDAFYHIAKFKQTIQYPFQELKKFFGVLNDIGKQPNFSK